AAAGEATGATSASQCPAGWPELPIDGPWAFVQNRRTRWASGSLWADVRISERVQARLWLQPDGPYEITVATSPGNPMPERRSTLIVRQPAKVSRILAVIEIYRETPRLIESPF
ncbi:MAG TPA: hypothetical protein VFK80_10975, partial [Limnochordia bacterium]|nr:hypothetical protein [Limnochordia bacterium]